MKHSPTLKSRLTEALHECGADVVGFARVAEVEANIWDDFCQWVQKGNNGAMAYMANHPDIRRNPELLLPGAKTMVVCAFPYYHSNNSTAAGFAMYAQGDDYHEVVRTRLQKVTELLSSEGFSCRICVDSAPLLERYWAVKAGVGFIGRSRLLIVPGKGSYYFLAEVLTDAFIEADAPIADGCGECQQCIRACPGGALRAQSGFDARLCLSYLTIEHRGDLPDELEGKSMGQLMNGGIYGCDVCQRVCPHNRKCSDTPIVEFHRRESLRSLTPEDILEMTPEVFTEIFRHSPVKRAKLLGLQRNARALSWLLTSRLPLQGHR